MKTLKKILCTFLVVVMCFTAAPLDGFIGLDWPKLPEINFGEFKLPNIDFSEWFSSKAEATETNYNFIKPVTHLKTVPEGYIGIYSIEDLKIIGENTKYLGSVYANYSSRSVYGYTGLYILMNDLDFSSIDNNDLYKWDHYFTGTFDGNGYELKNLSEPFFYAVANGATIKNLSVKSTGNGKICHYLLESTIDNCYSSGIINGFTNVTSHPYSTLGWSTSSYGYFGASGGLVGYSNYESKISYSYNTADIVLSAKGSGGLTASGGCTINVGGIVGEGYNIDNSYNIGTITITSVISNYSTYSNTITVGGISGSVTGKIDGCYNSGRINVQKVVGDSTNYIGGIVGRGAGDCTISNSFNIADVVYEDSMDSRVYISGVSGSSGSINNSYNIGALICKAPNQTHKSPWHKHVINPIVSTEYGGSIYNCYFLDNLSYDATTTEKGTPLSGLSMRKEGSFVGFDFDEMWCFDSEGNYPYPVLKKLPFDRVKNVPSDNTEVSFLKDDYSFYKSAKQCIDGDTIKIQLESTTQTIDNIKVYSENSDIVYIEDYELKSSVTKDQYLIYSCIEISCIAKGVGYTSLCVETDNGAIATCYVSVQEPNSVLNMSISSNLKSIEFINGKFYDDSNNIIDKIDATIEITNYLEDGSRPQLSEEVSKALSYDNVKLIYCTGTGGYFDKLFSKDVCEVEIYEIPYNTSRSFECSIYIDAKLIDAFLKGMSGDFWAIFAELYVDNTLIKSIDHTVDFSYALRLNEDDFNFINAQDFFVGNGEKDEYLISKEAKELIKWHDYIDISINSSFNWNGSCFGMSGLLTSFKDSISVNSFGSNTAYSLESPVKDGRVENLKLRDAINIIQVAQKLTPALKQTINFKSQEELRKQLVEDVKNIENGGTIPIVCLKKSGLFAGGHAVLAYNIIENKNNYEIYVSDPNYSGCRIMTIGKDYSTFNYDDGTYTNIKATITDLSIVDINNLAPGLLDSNIPTNHLAKTAYSIENTPENYTLVNLQDFKEVTISNENGEYAKINYENDTIDGTLDVIVTDVYGEGNSVQLYIPDDPNDIKKYTLSTDDASLKVSFNNNHIGGVFDISNSEGTEIEYRSNGYVAFDSENDSLYQVELYYFNSLDDVYRTSVSGVGEDALLEVSKDGVFAHADELYKTDLEVDHYDDFRKESLELIRYADKDSVLIKTDDKGNINLYEDTDSDKVYDKLVEGTLFFYNVLSDETIEITGVYGNKMDEIIIPRIYDGYLVSKIGERSFASKSSIKTVIVPDTINDIGYNAFYNCKNLTSIICYSDSCNVYQSSNTFPKKTAIYGYIGSTLEVYADKYSRTFVSLCKSTNTTEHKNTTFFESVVATCKNVGYTEGVYCSSCEQWIEGHIVVEKLSHTDKNLDGICEICLEEYMKVIKLGETLPITLNGSNEIADLIFIPNCSGKFKFYSSSSADTYGFIYDSEGNILRKNDNSGVGYNFYMEYDFIANTVYYLSLKQYDSTTSNIKISIECMHNYSTQLVDATCTSNGYKLYTCTICGNYYIEDEVSAIAHNFNDGQSKCSNCDYDKADSCSCKCHSTSFITKLIWKITIFFNKLFKKNQICSCGIYHY